MAVNSNVWVHVETFAHVHSKDKTDIYTHKHISKYTYKYIVHHCPYLWLYAYKALVCELACKPTQTQSTLVICLCLYHILHASQQEKKTIKKKLHTIQNSNIFSKHFRLIMFLWGIQLWVAVDIASSDHHYANDYRPFEKHV